MSVRRTHINAIMAEIDWLFMESVKSEEVKDEDQIRKGASLNGVESVFRIIDRRDKSALYRIACQKLERYLAANPDNNFELFREQKIKRARYFQSYFPDYATQNDQKKIYFDLEAWIEILTNLKPIDKDTRYSVSLFFVEGFEKTYPYPSIKYQIDNLGFQPIKFDGLELKIYTSELALVLMSESLKVTNCDSKKEEVIKGQMYIDTFAKGFKEGIEYFQKEYAVSPSVLYGSNAPQYVKVIEENYFEVKHKPNKSGWIAYKKSYPLILTHKNIQEQGFYSGILSSVDDMVKKHHHLFTQRDIDCRNGMADISKLAVIVQTIRIDFTKKQIMRKKILILCLLIISSIFGYCQTDKINDTDFIHFTDCQRYDNWKTDRGDTLKIRKSFLFDNKGNVSRKLEEVFEQEPRSKDLTVYHYDNKLLLNETLYKRTDMENVFDSKQLIYFYNKNGLIDSQVVINSFPYLDYKLREGNPDSTWKIQNIREFSDPIWKPLSEDTSSSPHAVMTTIQDGKEVMITGYKKVKKEVFLQEMSIDTLTNCKYYYNSKGQRIKEFFNSGYWNILGRTLINYDKNGRLSTVLCYRKNSYKYKDAANRDSINLWMRAYYTDNLKREDAVKQVEKRIKEEKSDTLLEYNSYVAYNKDGSVTETSVSSYKIYKLTSYRNQSGQMVKTINSQTNIQNKYKNGRFIPTDVSTLSETDFEFYETTSFYEYDSLGRIVKCTEKDVRNNDNGIKKGYRNTENFTIYKYNSSLPLKLPESEYVDGYSNDHHYYSIRK